MEEYPAGLTDLHIGRAAGNPNLSIGVYRILLPPVETFFLLTESGHYLLLENTGRLLIEHTIVPKLYIGSQLISAIYVGSIRAKIYLNNKRLC